MGGFAVHIGDLWQAATTVNTEARATSTASALPPLESGNPDLDDALAALSRSWGTQTAALAEVGGALALALGGCAVNYVDAEDAGAKAFGG